jgi:hypothetical protein
MSLCPMYSQLATQLLPSRELALGAEESAHGSRERSSCPVTAAVLRSSAKVRPPASGSCERTLRDVSFVAALRC